MATDYIPRKIAEFNTFQLNLVKAVADNGASWNIPAEVVTAWTAEAAAYKTVYTTQTNKAARTTVDVRIHAEFRKEYEMKIRLWVNAYVNGNMAVSPVIKDTLGLKKRGKKRNHRGRITANILFTLEPLRGGRVRIICREPEHRGRARLPHDSDGVELRYAIGTKPEHSETPSVTRHFSSTAKLLLDLGTANIGKYFYVFVRWRNLRHEEKSGSWSAMQEMMIA
ncbi:MAG: hypothetical protein V4615_10300 [Bacteroidota bacterium]